MSERLPPLRRREAIANALGCGALLLLSFALVVLAIVGLVELLGWLL